MFTKAPDKFRSLLEIRSRQDVLKNVSFEEIFLKDHLNPEDEDFSEVLKMLYNLYVPVVIDKKDHLQLVPHRVENRYGNLVRFHPDCVLCELDDMFKENINDAEKQSKVFTIPVKMYVEVSVISPCPACQSRLDFFMYMDELYSMYTEFLK